MKGTSTSTRFFYKDCNIFAQAWMLLNKIKIFWKCILPDEKVFKLLFGTSAIILKWSHNPDGIIFLVLFIKMLLINEKACTMIPYRFLY